MKRLIPLAFVCTIVASNSIARPYYLDYHTPISFDYAGIGYGQYAPSGNDLLTSEVALSKFELSKGFSDFAHARLEIGVNNPIDISQSSLWGFGGINVNIYPNLEMIIEYGLGKEKHHKEASYFDADSYRIGMAYRFTENASLTGIYDRREFQIDSNNKTFMKQIDLTAMFFLSESVDIGGNYQFIFDGAEGSGWSLVIKYLY